MFSQSNGSSQIPNNSSGIDNVNSSQTAPQITSEQNRGLENFLFSHQWIGGNQLAINNQLVIGLAHKINLPVPVVIQWLKDKRSILNPLLNLNVSSTCINSNTHLTSETNNSISKRK